MAQTKKNGKKTGKSKARRVESPETSPNMRRVLQVLSTMTDRASVAARLGHSFGGDRDLYEALGYAKQISFSDYMAKYLRQDLARAVIDAPVNASWAQPPVVEEKGEMDESAFDERWLALVDNVRLWHYFTRIDRLASIGQYAVLLIGYDDSAKLEERVQNARRVLYLTPFSESNAPIAASVTDVKNSRFGLPETYSINMQSSAGVKGSSVQLVHYSRVVHVAGDCLESEVLGTPKLEVIYNRLQGIETVAGGSAEMFWRGAFPGYGFNVNSEATVGTQDLADLQSEIEEYMHGLKRYLRLRGVKVESLDQQVSDPSNHISVLVDLIAGATRIPKRILLGSERGELASSQDERNWLTQILARQKNYCEPVIVRAFIDNLIAAGALLEPAEGYNVTWADLLSPSAKEKADVAAVISKAVKDYVDSGADIIMPPDFFFKDVLGMTQEDVDRINRLVEDQNSLADGRPGEDDE